VRACVCVYNVYHMVDGIQLLLVVY